jgi:hypothetical protein
MSARFLEPSFEAPLTSAIGERRNLRMRMRVGRAGSRG